MTMIAPIRSETISSAGTCPITGATAKVIVPSPPPVRPADPSQLIDDARQFLELLHREGVVTLEAQRRRFLDVRASLAERASYWQSAEELEHGAKVAWRNSSRCIGRLYWQKLLVRDLRHLNTAEAVFEALVEHLRLATNRGKIVPVISVFAPTEPGTPGIRIWNSQLIRYAGYRKEDGLVVGDPLSVEFTELVRELGWAGGEGTPFDLLPLVIQMPGEEPRLFELPREVVLEVPITHPEHPQFAALALKWHAVPVIANMRLEIGGVSYTAAPFNGWYMGTEIGARNFADESRYDLLPTVARLLGMDTRSSRTLWRDRALVELNVAVLHSFSEAGVTIIDHHTASKHFLRHEEFERQANRPVSGDWSWLVPPISGSVSPLFHREYFDTPQTPNFFYQPNPWAESVPYAAQHAAQLDAERGQRDALTGLLHRGGLDTRLAPFCHQGGAIALVDIDSFKTVNQEHGEIVGNAILRSIGRELLSAVRPDDECARFGGDAFCVLLRGVETLVDARVVAERIARALESVRVEGAETAAVTVSIGVALVAPGEDPANALNRSSSALQSAKRAGAGQIAMDESIQKIALVVPPAEPEVVEASVVERSTGGCPWHAFLDKLPFGRGSRR